jgi:3-hydroxyisobutyrate dehydrogenase-like beta-hydroxyacid dehydrogenase
MSTQSPVSVLGLGAMGTAIASTLLERGHDMTVWNRTGSKATPLADAGANVADTATEAILASPMTIVCLIDNSAVRSVFSAIDGAVRDRVLVNVTSGSPSQARKLAQWAQERGATYIDGGIMGDPPNMGSASMMLTFSGNHDAFDAHRRTLEDLGTVGYYGEDAGLAAVEFMGQVAVGYEFLLGLLHTLHLVHSEGADVEAFAERVAASISGYAPLAKSFGSAIVNGEYEQDLGSLDVQAALMDDLISHREALGVDTLRMREAKRLMDRRIRDGHGHEGFSSVFELIREEHRPEPS